LIIIWIINLCIGWTKIRKKAESRGHRAESSIGQRAESIEPIRAEGKGLRAYGKRRCGYMPNTLRINF